MKPIFAAVTLALVLLVADNFKGSGQQPPQRSATAQEKLDALNDAYRNGLLTQQEYQAKLAALKAVAASGRGASVDPPQDFGSTKTVPIIDPMFHMVAYTMQIPADWEFEGVVLQGPGCQGQYTSVTYRAYSPDLRYGIQLVPWTGFLWADDPRTLPKFGNCKFLPPISAADYAQFVSIRMHPGAVIDAVGPSPDEPIAQANLSKVEPTFFNQVGIQLEVSRVHLRFDLDGQPEEEALQARMVLRKLMVMTNISHTAAVGYVKKPEYASRANVTAFHAPLGQLNSHFAAMATIIQSLRVDPQYAQTSSAYFQNQSNMAIAASWASFNSIMETSREQFQIMSQNATNFINNMNAEGERRHNQVMADLDSQDRHTKDVTDWILNQQVYQNPNTGQTFTGSNQYRYTYTDQNGNYVQSNAYIDPNVLYHADWTSATPIHH